jgi:hypothetical protein
VVEIEDILVEILDVVGALNSFIIKVFLLIEIALSKKSFDFFMILIDLLSILVLLERDYLFAQQISLLPVKHPIHLLVLEVVLLLIHHFLVFWLLLHSLRTNSSELHQTLWSYSSSRLIVKHISNCLFQTHLLQKDLVIGLRPKTLIVNLVLSSTEKKTLGLTYVLVLLTLVVFSFSQSLLDIVEFVQRLALVKLQGHVIVLSRSLI